MLNWGFWETLNIQGLTASASHYIGNKETQADPEKKKLQDFLVYLFVV